MSIKEVSSNVEIDLLKCSLVCSVQLLYQCLTGL